MGEAELEKVEELIYALAEQERKENPVAGFVPNGKIAEFIRAVGEDEKKHTFVLAAGNGLGKTSGTIACMVNLMYGPQSEWFRGKRFVEWDYPKRAWYISEQATLKNVVCGVEETGRSEIRKWMPRGRYRFTKSGYDYFSQLTTDTEWSVSFMTFDMDKTQFESDTVGLVILDEPPPEELFNACVARLRQGGLIIMPMTPLYHSAWVKDRLVDNATEESGVYVLYGDIEDQCIEHGVRGILHHEHIMRMVNEYDDEERDARKSGQFMHLSGLVYKGLHAAKHRHEYALEHFNQKEYKIINVVDPHDAKPPACGWFAVDKYKNPWGVGEYPTLPEYPLFHQIKNFNLTTMEVCVRIKEFEQEAGWDPSQIIRVMDPNFGQKPIQAVGKTVKQVFRRCGKELKWPLNYSTRVNDDLSAGHRIVRDMLKIHPDFGVQFRIGMNCPNMWYGLTHYSRKHREGKRLDVDGMGEAVAEKYKDFADIVRYMGMFLRGPKGEESLDAKNAVPEYLQMYDHLYPPRKQGWRNPEAA